MPSACCHQQSKHQATSCSHLYCIQHADDAQHMYAATQLYACSSIAIYLASYSQLAICCCTLEVCRQLAQGWLGISFHHLNSSHVTYYDEHAFNSYNTIAMPYSQPQKSVFINGMYSYSKCFTRPAWPYLLCVVRYTYVQLFSQCQKLNVLQVYSY